MSKLNFKARAVNRFGKEKINSFKCLDSAKEFVQGIEKKGGRGAVQDIAAGAEVYRTGERRG